MAEVLVLAGQDAAGEVKKITLELLTERPAGPCRLSRLAAVNELN